LRVLAVLSVALLLVGCGSQPAAPAAPKAEQAPVSDTTTPAPVLAHEVQSIITASCLPCHAAGGSAAKYDLTSPEGLAKLVVPGRADSSKLYQVLASGKMPPAGKLDSVKLATIRSWINEGAKDK
jgi:cytochrome c5